MNKDCKHKIMLSSSVIVCHDCGKEFDFEHELEEARKEGAKNELEKILNFYDDGKVRKTINISVAVLKKRLKELE